MYKIVKDMKEYLFGSDKFYYRYFDPNCYPIDYDFIFTNTDDYFPFLDENNVPYSKEKVYNFSGVSGFALANYNRYLESADLKHRIVFFKQIEFFESHAENHSYPSFQDFDNFKHPWFSSLYQGLVASCYIRAYLLTNDFKYVLLAKESIEFVLRYKGRQKLIKKIQNMDITQEYPGVKAPNVLNGHLSFLIGALETNRYLKVNNEREINLDMFLAPLSKFLVLCSKNKWSIYNVNGLDKFYNYSTLNYHNLHISQVKYIAIMTNCGDYDNIINNWQKGKKSRATRLYAMLQKIKYKILNEQ